MAIEHWCADHPFTFGVICLLVGGLGFGPFASDIRTFLLAVPHGVRAARRQVRRVTVARLIRFRDDPHGFYRTLIATAVLVIFAACALAYVELGYFARKAGALYRLNPTDPAIIALEVEAVYITVTVGVCGALVASLMVLQSIWSVRNAERRIEQLQHLLDRI